MLFKDFSEKLKRLRSFQFVNYGLDGGHKDSKIVIAYSWPLLFGCEIEKKTP